MRRKKSTHRRQEICKSSKNLEGAGRELKIVRRRGLNAERSWLFSAVAFSDPFVIGTIVETGLVLDATPVFKPLLGDLG